MRPDNTPANRTVVFRGFLERSDRLMIISDRRSQKTVQIRHNPHAEVCWYFTKTREQFRMSGELMLVSDQTDSAHFQKARRQLWQKISDSARLQFAWPEPRAARTEDSNFAPDAPDATTPLSTFCMLLLYPHSVDYLSLRGEPQTRKLYQRTQKQDQTEEWSCLEVNP